MWRSKYKTWEVDSIIIQRKTTQQKSNHNGNFVGAIGGFRGGLRKIDFIWGR